MSNPALVQTWTKVKPLLPTWQQLPIILLIAVYILLGLEAGAQTIDSLSNNAGSKICTFGKSINTSLLVRGICVAVAAWGLVKWVPTRKDGTGEMIGGVVAFIVASKFMTILGFFGVNCS